MKNNQSEKIIAGLARGVLSPSPFAAKTKDRMKENGIKTKMRVKLASKLLVIVWTLMKKKGRFDPTILR